MGVAHLADVICNFRKLPRGADLAMGQPPKDPRHVLARLHRRADEHRKTRSAYFFDPIANSMFCRSESDSKARGVIRITIRSESSSAFATFLAQFSPGDS